MVEVRANIKLYKGENRRTIPFTSGYRPHFNFISSTMTSGHIVLVDQNEFYPGEEGDVIISFPNKEFLGSDFNVGTKFNFFEGKRLLGEGIILDILKSD